MAPEAIKNKTYSTKSDVYSFAITTWELIARSDVYPEFDAVGAAMKVVYEGLRPPTPKGASEPIVEVSLS